MMKNKKPPVWNYIRKSIHWLALAVLIYIFGYAGLYKIVGVESMMESMASIGFGTT